ERSCCDEQAASRSSLAKIDEEVAEEFPILSAAPKARRNRGTNGGPMARPRHPATVSAVPLAPRPAVNRPNRGTGPRAPRAAALVAGRWYSQTDPASRLQHPSSAAPADRDRGRRHTSPAPEPVFPRKDGSRTGRQSLRADCRRTIP